MKHKFSISRLLVVLLIFYVFIVSIIILFQIISFYFPPPTSMRAVIHNGLVYLNDQINPELGLLRESPVVAPNRYWLTNDNALASYTFSQFGYKDTRRMILQNLDDYGDFENNFIEVVMGHVVYMPPRVPDAVLITKIGDAEIWTEKHVSDNRYEDWQEYANLGFMVALNHVNLDIKAIAQELIMKTMGMFDGKGFRDKAFNGSYDTYKLALAIYTARNANMILHEEEIILDILLKMLDKNGGFLTRYDENLNPLGDTNTETTSFALLAIHSLVYR
ncbi:MAG: hypothetical protein IH585_00765 [Anaerolineaceae bacterium]|nr:hypothetical protein [Anaerolineaceae bacterium]